MITSRIDRNIIVFNKKYNIGVLLSWKLTLAIISFCVQYFIITFVKVLELFNMARSLFDMEISNVFIISCILLTLYSRQAHILILFNVWNLSNVIPSKDIYEICLSDTV